jgi:acyl carrier protein phosphodiesterase
LDAAKKKSTHAGRGEAWPAEQDHPDVKAARARATPGSRRFADVRVDPLVFLDEGAARHWKMISTRSPP